MVVLGLPWALKPLGAHTQPSTSFQGPFGIRMGAAGMSKADVGAAIARQRNLFCSGVLYREQMQEVSLEQCTVLRCTEAGCSPDACGIRGWIAEELHRLQGGEGKSCTGCCLHPMCKLQTHLSGNA